MIDSMGYGGISLADVEYLVIRDNIIEDNDLIIFNLFAEIFVLHGEGIEISRNRIMNNGAKNKSAFFKYRKRVRGGIRIVILYRSPLVDLINEKQYPGQNGFPAAKIHDNIISVPLGRALSVTALGPVSVIGNSLQVEV